MESQFDQPTSQENNNNECPEEYHSIDIPHQWAPVYLASYENEDELSSHIEEEEVREPPSTPRKVAHKRPRAFEPVSIDDPIEEPDLATYFSGFDHFSEQDQVKYCRAYASMLASKSAKNRLRGGHGRNPFY